MKRVTNQAGFTIIELLVATLVFSVIFLGTTTALIEIGKLYYKGVVTGRTQETARGVIDQLSQQLQFTSARLQTGSTQYNVTDGADGSNKMTFSSVCVGTTRYSYRLNAQVDSSTKVGTYEKDTNHLLHGLWKDTVASGSGCPAADLSQTTPTVFGEEVLSQHSRLSAFSVSCDNTTGNNLCSLQVGIAYGDNDLLAFDGSGNPDHCQSIIGSQWCAVSEFQASVLGRVEAK